MEAKKKFKLRAPHSIVLLFGLIIFAAILTYIIPAGQYQTIVDAAGNETLDPNSFSFIENTPAKLWDILGAIPKGFVATAELIVFIFIAGGTFQIINATGSLEAGMKKAVSGIQDKGWLVVAVLTFLASVLGGVIGAGVELVVFVPLAVSIVRKLGYDSFTATVSVILGSYVGFISGTFNPYTVGVAQGLLGLPLFSGL